MLEEAERGRNADLEQAQKAENHGLQRMEAGEQTCGGRCLEPALIRGGGKKNQW